MRKPRTGTERIVSARQRLANRGYAIGDNGEQPLTDHLVWAARCHADLAIELLEADRTGVGGYGLTEVPHDWPEDLGKWKPAKCAERNLEIAGALLAAALDQLEKFKRSGRKRIP